MAVAQTRKRSKPSLHDKVAETRKQHLVESAARVFAERGFHQATIRHVAVEAGVSDGTIYNSFENKAALLLALLDPLDERSAAPPPLGAEADLEASIRQLFRARWATFTPETLQVLRVVLSEALVHEELRSRYVKRVLEPAIALPAPYFDALVATERMRAVDVPMLLRTVAAAFTGLVMLRLFGDAELERRWDEVPDHLADLLLNGLSPRKTRTRRP